MAMSSQQIVTMATYIARCQGMTSLAGQMLNAILGDLAQTNDFDILRASTTLHANAASASYTLPTNYLRAREVFYSIQGTIFYLNQLPLDEYDQLFQGPGINNYPEQYATDMAATPPVMYFWPPPNIVIPVTVRYQQQPADITTPETSTVAPWFASSRYLYTKLAADLMALTDDSRRGQYLEEAVEILKRYLMLDDDKEGYAQTISLDRRNFRSTDGLKPTKVTGF